MKMANLSLRVENYHYRMWEYVREYDVEDIKYEVDDPVFLRESSVIDIIEFFLWGIFDDEERDNE